MFERYKRLSTCDQTSFILQYVLLIAAVCKCLHSCWLTVESILILQFTPFSCSWGLALLVSEAKILVAGALTVIKSHEFPH